MPYLYGMTVFGLVLCAGYGVDAIGHLFSGVWHHKTVMSCATGWAAIVILLATFTYP